MKEFKCLLKGDTLSIILPKELRDKVWSEEFGTVQQLMDDNRQAISKISIDFFACTWIDALPLLSLVLNIVEYKNECKIELLQFKFASKTSDQKRVLAFVLVEGFLAAMETLSPKFLLDDQNWDYLKIVRQAESFISHLLYKDATIIKATMITLNEEEDNERTIVNRVDSLLETGRHRMENKISYTNYKETFSTIRLFLIEAINNIYDHAYPQSKLKTCAIYVRFRQGMADPVLSQDGRIKLSSAISKAQQEIGRIRRNFVDNVSGFIEVFVIDHGIGFAKSYLDHLSYQRTKYVFRPAWESVFGEGKRNPRQLKKKATRFGGLYVIGRLVKKGFLIGRDENEWMGEVLPIISESHAGFNVQPETKVKGFALIGRIAWTTSSDKNKDWLRISEVLSIKEMNFHPFTKAMETSADVYHKYYKQSYGQLGANIFFVVDERFKQSDQNLPRNYLKSTEATNYAFWLPKEDHSKFDIHKIVESSFVDINNPSEVIIICDIPDHEIDVYQFALERANFNEAFLNRVEKLILVSRNLSVLVLAKQIHSGGIWYAKDAEAATEYITTIKKDFRPHQSLFQLLEWLKTHDTMIFWRNLLSRDNKKDYFTKGKIIWYSGIEDTTLTTYFNFAETLSDNEMLELYDRSLNRAMSLRNEEGFVFVGNDGMTKKLASMANGKANEKFSQTGAKIELGSVYVTGSTQENFFKENRVASDDYHVIHFLHNRSGKVRGRADHQIASLFLWPDEKFINLIVEATDLPFRRVGNLSVIAPHGWKYYTVPRYVHRDPALRLLPLSEMSPSRLRDDDFISVSVASPPETYKDWQTASNISIGHFENDSYHDLFKIDIPYAFDESWSFSGQLSVFVISEFMIALGVEIEKLHLEMNKHLKSTLQQYMVDKNLIVDPEHKTGCVIYPYHFSTDHIVKKIKTIFPKNVRERIVPLLPINKSHVNAPYLLSYHAMQRLREIAEIYQKAENKNKPPILFFDSLKINGKLEQEVKHLLTLSGISDILVLNIVDRSRMPLHPIGLDNHKAYWRMDVPVLGPAESCVICKSIEKINELRPFLSSELLVEQLNTWQRRWGKIYKYLHDIDNHGIKSKDIHLKHSEKKFGVYFNEKGETQQIGGDKNKIHLTSSVGITIYASEILSMTTRDNILLEITENEQLSKDIAVEVLACNLILNNRFLSRSTRIKIIRKLFNTARLIEDSNPYTALAALVLVNESEIDDKALFEWCFEQGDDCITVMNLDVLLFLCYWAHTHPSSKVNDIPEVIRCLNAPNNRFKVSKEFHGILYNDSGDTHNRPLHLIKDRILNKQVMVDSYVSLRKLEKILMDHLIYDVHNPSLITKFESRKDEINEKIKKLSQLVGKFSKINSLEFDELPQNLRMRAAIFPLVRSIETYFKEAHHSLFAPLNLKRVDEESAIIKTVRLILTGSQRDVKISIKSEIDPDNETNIRDYWVPWNKLIIAEVGYIIDNSKHVATQYQEKICDPFADDLSADMADMWISVEQADHFFHINFFNKSSRSAEFVDEETRKKHRYEMAYIRDIRGDIKFSNEPYKHDTSQLLLKTTITLPLI